MVNKKPVVNLQQSNEEIQGMHTDTYTYLYTYICICMHVHAYTPYIELCMRSSSR